MDGQFDDADASEQPRITTATLIAGPHQPTRGPGAYLDDDEPPSILQGVQAGPDLEEDEEDDEYWDSEMEELDAEYQRTLSTGLNEVMDQDWDVLSGDFTKRYNRMRQQVVATHSAVPRPAGSTAKPLEDPTVRPGNILPPTNRSKATAAPSRPLPSDPSASTGVHTNKVSDQLAAYSRYAARLQVEPLYPTSATTSRKGGSEKVLIKDKADRATVEQVLDPRTRLIIFKMIGRELIERVDGCVSTGKEANVYHAVAPDGKHLALKIYKTSILVFKDRDRYVTGEFRFKSGYARSNPRKMVRLWAEKEMRNLRRMKTAGMRVPEAIEVRENVLVMDFLGEQEWQASPRLKDAVIPAENLRSLYLEMLVLLRTIFIRCRLVHADFSEYNVLYHQSHLWVIDVSQSVEQDHPHAFDFLRSDIQNADDFFKKRGVDTIGLTRTFNYVTKDSKPTAGLGAEETDEEMWTEAERLVSAVELEGEDDEEDGEGTDTNGSSEGKGKEVVEGKRPTELDEAVFAQSYIPRALDEVYDPERDVNRVLRGEGKGLIYADITGVASIHNAEASGEAKGKGKENPEKVRFAEGSKVEVGEEEEEEGEEGESGDEEGSSDNDDDSGDEEEGDGDFEERRPRGKKHEDKDEKKKRRAETKQAAREKRTEKMKKSEKKRRVKKSSGKK
ncbi:RIO1-domain-containing protein [Meredithblackwellia eburnea MCA 4105]